MPSPYQAATAAAITGLAYSNARHIEQLCDGSYLALYQSAAATLSLTQITSPGATAAFTAVAQTFTVASSTNTVGDLFILNNGTTTSDVWVVWASNTTTAGLFVAHGTYTASGASWSWDNTSTTIAATPIYGVPAIVWTGANLIIVSRIGSFHIGISSTTTKNGSTGWSAVAQLSSTSNSSSHFFPTLLHDATNGLTIAVYTLQADHVVARVIADASTPTVANWSAEVTLSTATAINVGAANLAATLDPANKRLHVVYSNTSVATNPYYVASTYTTTAITAGTPFSIDSGATTAAGVTIGLDAASPPNAWVAWGTGAIGSASDIEYAKIASPYTSASAATNLTNASANDNAYPNLPRLAAMGGGYAPLLYAHALSPWPVEYDNSIAVSGGGTTIALSGTIPSGGALAGYLATAGTQIGDVTVSTQSQTWSGGPAGSPGTENDVTYTDATGDGWRVGMIPTYGGAAISSWYPMEAGAQGVNQTSLSTSTPDGHIHWLEQSSGAVFAGSEDKPFTLTEQAPTGTPFRRYYLVSFGPDANGFNWNVSVCIYPGDPGFIAYRFDCINPTASAIALASSDSLEIALIGGLQQADTTWSATNGLYGSLGGTAVAWPVASATGNPVAADPDYVYITPAATGSAATLSLMTVKQQLTTAYSPAWASAQLSALVNTNRLKLKIMGTQTSFPASTTSTVYLLNVLRRGLTAADAAAIAADYINPGTPAVTAGTFTSFSYDERAYVFAASATCTLGATLDLMPAHVTARYKPIIKITSWDATSNPGAPVVTWGGAHLTAGADFRYVVDATNSVLYLQLYTDVYPAGTAGLLAPYQRANAALSVSPAPLALANTLPSGASLSATLAVTRPLAVTLASGAALSGALSRTVALSGALPSGAGLSATLTPVKALTATLASGSRLSGALRPAKPLTGILTSGAGINASLSRTVALSGALASGANMTSASALLITRALAVTLLSQAAMAGALTVGASGIHLAGALPSGGGGSGALTISRPLTGALTSADALLALLAVTRPLRGTLASDAALTGSMRRTATLTGTLTAAAGLAASGGLLITRRLSATLLSADALSGVLTVTASGVVGTVTGIVFLPNALLLTVARGLYSGSTLGTSGPVAYLQNVIAHIEPTVAHAYKPLPDAALTSDYTVMVPSGADIAAGSRITAITTLDGVTPWPHEGPTANEYWDVIYADETSAFFIPQRLLYVKRVTGGGMTHF